MILDDNKTLKVIDFGTSKQVKEKTMTVIGSDLYMDLLVRDHQDKEGYDPFKADIWSLGCILHTMLIGEAPYTANNTYDLD